MSVKVSTWAWHDEATTGLKIGPMLVLLALADIANDEGDVVFVSHRKKDGEQAALARKCHMSVASFRRITAELAERGFLTISRESKTSPNQYRVNVTAQFERSPVSGHTAQVERSERSAVSAHRDVLRIDVTTADEGPSSKRGSRLSAEWRPAPGEVAYAVEHAPSIDIERTVEDFVDYWVAVPGQRGVKVDWSRTWQTWVRRAHDRNVERGWVAPASYGRVLREGADAGRDAWLAARGVTFEEYLERKGEAGWLSSLESSVRRAS